MRFLPRLFGPRREPLPPRPQSCDVFYSAREIVVFASHRDVVGMMPIGSPMKLLPIDAAAAEIGTAVLESLRGSRDGLSESDGEEQTQAALGLVGARSWDALEMKRERIIVVLEKDPDRVTIAPMHRYATGGHVSEVNDPVYTVPADPMEVGRTIRELVKGEPLAVVQRAR